MELRNFFKKKQIEDITKKEQAFYQKNTRKKFLKIFAAASLALITCATTLLATAPFGTGAANAATNSTLSNNTQTTPNNGLITPQEDDPVLFKTESGIEIKWGNASQNGVEILEGSSGTLETGNLQGFPYFTTNDGTTNYTWVIIGRSENFTYNKLLTIETTQKTLNTWINLEGSNTIIEYYSRNIYETNSPAGISLSADNIANDYVVIKKQIGNIIQNLNSLTATSEIPEGSVLCLANDIISTGVSNTSSLWAKSDTRASHSYYTGNLKTVMDGYCLTLGLEKILVGIETISLTTYGIQCNGSPSFWTYTTNTVNARIFPLASTGQFTYSTYLTNEQAKLSTGWWLRNGVNTYQSYWQGYVGSILLSCL